ncbi:hypothetical protein SATRM34S_00147 [Streptomyces atroolivaceus]
MASLVAVRQPSMRRGRGWILRISLRSLRSRVEGRGSRSSGVVKMCWPLLCARVTRRPRRDSGRVHTAEAGRWRASRVRPSRCPGGRRTSSSTATAKRLPGLYRVRRRPGLPRRPGTGRRRLPRHRGSHAAPPISGSGTPDASTGSRQRRPPTGTSPRRAHLLSHEETGRSSATAACAKPVSTTPCSASPASTTLHWPTPPGATSSAGGPRGCRGELVSPGSARRGGRPWWRSGQP